MYFAWQPLPASVIFRSRALTLRVFRMAHFPKPHPSIRAPRAQFSNPEPADFRIEDKIVRGHLRRLSKTGGCAVLNRKLRGPMLAEIDIPTRLGSICGLIEFITPRAELTKASELGFRFVGLDDAHYERLTAALKRFG
jgi:hypothetical protein